METIQTKPDLLQKLNIKIKDIKIALLTSINLHGDPHTRPMATLDMDEDGCLWFFTNQYSGKVNEISSNTKVSIGYLDSTRDIFVTVYGDAELVLDKNKMEKLWQPSFKTWFPQGLNDPKLGLLKISINSAEHWDFNSHKMVQLFRSGLLV